MKWEWSDLIWFVPGLLLLAVPIWLLVLYMNAPTNFTHCYVEYYNGSDKPYYLMGSLKNAPDTRIAQFSTMEQAVQGARDVNCELK